MNKPLLRIERLRKTYAQKGRPLKDALRDVSFDLHQGEVLGLLGVNGAGKTTLSSILATLHPPTEGDVKWNDRSIYEDLLNYRKIMGFCPQKPNLDRTISVEENLIFAGRCFGLSRNEAIKRKEELLEQFHLKESASSHVYTLSGGYRQRFLIARAMMHRPQLIILDEPTVGLDPHIRRQLWDVIAQLKSSHTTVLLTTHYLDEAEALSDRVCLIHAGTIRTIDSPQHLKSFHQKNNLEEVFLKFVNDPDAEVFNSVTAEPTFEKEHL